MAKKDEDKRKRRAGKASKVRATSHLRSKTKVAKVASTPARKPVSSKKGQAREISSRARAVSKKRPPVSRKRPVPASRKPKRDTSKKVVPLRKSVKPAKASKTKKPLSKKPLPRKLAGKPPKKPPRKPSVKPPRESPRKRPRKPAKKPLPKPPRKRLRKPARKPPRKPLRPPLRPKRLPPGRKPPRRKRKPKKPARRKYPPWIKWALSAEALMQDKLGTLMTLLVGIEPGLDTAIKSMVNADGTVDAELRIGNLPSEWRSIEGLPLIVSALSEALRGMGAFPSEPTMGGAFWISFGVRFGPSSQKEILQFARIYKRFRGLLQIGVHYTSADALTGMLNNAAGIRMLIERLWQRRDLPPVQLLVRVTWTPKAGREQRPARYAGEEGDKA